MKALILVATLGGPTMFARIGIMRALNRQVAPKGHNPVKARHCSVDNRARKTHSCHRCGSPSRGARGGIFSDD
jgi:hypothetical protein